MGNQAPPVRILCRIKKLRWLRIPRPKDVQLQDDRLYARTQYNSVLWTGLAEPQYAVANLPLVQLKKRIQGNKDVWATIKHFNRQRQ
jgi:hypothetical protein